MMILKNRTLPIWLTLAAAIVTFSPMRQVRAQNTSTAKTQSNVAASQPAATSSQPADRSQAYFHDALASVYEDDAVAQGQQEFANRAI